MSLVMGIGVDIILITKISSLQNIDEVKYRSFLNKTFTESEFIEAGTIFTVNQYTEAE